LRIAQPIRYVGGEMEISIATAASLEVEQDERLIRRAWWHIIPLVTYLVSAIDRMNVSFAKPQMVLQIGLIEPAYGLASSLFFIGYLIFEIPSALGNMFGSAFGSVLLSLDGVWHHAGWQWAFIVTGLLALMLTPIVLFCTALAIQITGAIAPVNRSAS
jgi:sugar phosphate permease